MQPHVVPVAEVDVDILDERHNMVHIVPMNSLPGVVAVGHAVGVQLFIALTVYLVRLGSQREILVEEG